MRHRIKKIPSLISNFRLHSKTLRRNHHLLHSDKSTYFYNNKLVCLVSGHRTIPLVLPASVLLLVLVSLVCPINSTSAVERVSASSVTEEECLNNTRMALSFNGVSGDEVNLVNNNVSNDITNHRISKLSQDFNVVACNVKNYKIYVQADSSLLKNQQAPDALLPVGNNVSEADFGDNVWGYNISPKTTSQENLTYNTVPDISNTIPEAYVENKSTSYNGKDFTISFAAKFGQNKTAGHYASNILLSIVADPNVTLLDIETMQEMTPKICANSSENMTKQLIDIRDNKSYWVAKLKDDNCWMTQNLDYDDPDGIRRTGDTQPDSWPSENDMRQYWDPEDKIVNGSTLVAASDDTDRHLLVGNYYSWLSATNGTGSDVTIDGGDASGSICPEGWRLPIGNSNGEFQMLADRGESDWSAYPDTAIYGYWLGGTSATANGAAFFSANGYAAYDSLNRVGSHGYYWSSTIFSLENTYDLLVYSGGVLSSYNDPRYLGISVRCVAQ